MIWDEEPEILVIRDGQYRHGNWPPAVATRRKTNIIIDAYIQALVKRQHTTYHRPHLGREWAEFTEWEINLINRQLDRTWLVAWLDGKPGEYGEVSGYSPIQEQSDSKGTPCPPQ